MAQDKGDFVLIAKIGYPVPGKSVLDGHNDIFKIRGGVMKTLQDKVAIVTGASSGIGRTAAK